MVKEAIAENKRENLYLVSKVLPNHAGRHQLEQALD